MREERGGGKRGRGGTRRKRRKELGRGRRKNIVPF